MDFCILLGRSGLDAHTAEEVMLVQLSAIFAASISLEHM